MIARWIGSSILATLVVGICLCRVSEPNLDKITLDCEKIFVKIGNGSTSGVLVDPEDTMRSVMEDMNELEGMLFTLIDRIVLDNRLDLDAKLSGYIRANTTLALVIPENLGRRVVEFIVSTREGRDLPITSPLNITVASLKETIAARTGIPQVEQRLLLAGKELKDERKLAHYKIYDRTTIVIGGPLEECRRSVTVPVKTLSGASVRVEVSLSETVNGLKQKILERTGIPACVQRIFANGRAIAGEDHLCDLGLEAGSIVYMLLYSARITNLDQFARLQEPPVACRSDPHRAPIFHEADDAAEPAQSGRRASLYKDARNWAARSGSRRALHLGLFDPVAYLEPNPDDVEWIQQNRLPRNRLDDIQIKFSLAVRHSQTSVNLTSRQRPGISLGGGGPTEVGQQQQVVPLRADINYWAPDVFSDSDVMRLFEVAERVRQVLASDAQTGEGTLSIAAQRRINRAILFTYFEALARRPQSVELNQPREDEVCGICMDDLAVEPAAKLPCGHAFHADCIAPWAIDLIQAELAPSCPYCRQRFMLPYVALGKAELDALGMPGNQVE